MFKFLSRFFGNIYLRIKKRNFEKFSGVFYLEFPLDIKVDDNICIILPSTSEVLDEMLSSIKKVLAKFKGKKILIGVDFLRNYFLKYGPDVEYISYKPEEGLNYLYKFKEIGEKLEDIKVILDLSRREDAWKIAVLSKAPYRFSGNSSFYPYFNIIYNLGAHFKDRDYSEKLVDFFLKFVKEKEIKSDEKGNKTNST